MSFVGEIKNINKINDINEIRDNSVRLKVLPSLAVLSGSALVRGGVGRAVPS